MSCGPILSLCIVWDNATAYIGLQYTHFRIQYQTTKPTPFGGGIGETLRTYQRTNRAKWSGCVRCACLEASAWQRGMWTRQTHVLMGSVSTGPIRQTKRAV